MERQKIEKHVCVCVCVSARESHADRVYHSLSGFLSLALGWYLFVIMCQLSLMSYLGVKVYHLLGGFLSF